ncbi:hypothetical protein M2169_005656 [Streptomyces sp. MJP52]|nr:hypothetical protein [Streptomyces sp. MJP52]
MEPPTPSPIAAARGAAPRGAAAAGAGGGIAPGAGGAAPGAGGAPNTTSCAGAGTGTAVNGEGGGGPGANGGGGGTAPVPGGGQDPDRAWSRVHSASFPSVSPNAWSWTPPQVSSPVTWPSTVAPRPSGTATNWRTVPRPELMPSSQGWSGRGR